ncbi:hypothetical protein [Dubosiella newyorkensis]|uniref:hypothetical protein n=1 Tax=Dubosiella newyorkensis TaxID=1862672 RepID=UPI0027310175|nr:hypothetical protein [Dubosiella newyorkensis]
MAQLSRTKKYQPLRDQLDEETTAAQSAPVRPRLSRVQNHSLSHANKPLHSHEEENALSSKSNEFQTSPVMDELLGEVKQYNIDNGTRITDDTQINILRQLDQPQGSQKRTAHFVEMEDDDEDEGGTTMKLPKGLKDEAAMASLMPSNQKLTRINPVRVKEVEQESVKIEPEEKEPATERIVLSSNDILADDKADTDQLTVLTTKQHTVEEFNEEPVVQKPRKTKSKKKKKSSRPAKKEKAIVEDEMPSAKMRMRAEDFENDLPEKTSKKSNTIMNIVLIVLIVLLIVSIFMTFYFIRGMGVL